MKLKIDPDFKIIIPSLSAEEFEQLEQNILSEKRCRDAILIWKGFIVDGHNRYEICQKHKIAFKVSKMNFASKKEALIWIADNQLGRRNLSNAVRIDIASRRAQLLFMDRPINIRKTVAEAAGVGERTVYKYMKLVGYADAKTLEKLRRDEIKIGTAFREMRAETRVVRQIDVGSKGYLGVVDRVLKVGGVYFGVGEAERSGRIEGVGKCLDRQLGLVDGCLGGNGDGALI